MARKLQGTRNFTISGALSVLVATSLAWSQGVAPDTPPKPEPFSQDCQAGSTAIATDYPLPNVAAALRQRKQIKILAVGTSSAVRRGSWRGGHTDEARQILQEAIKGLDVVMINRGVGGELSAQAVERIQNEVALNEPDLVIWQVGTDDALAYIPLAEFESTVVDLVRWLKAHKVDVVLVGLQFVDSMEQDDHYRGVRELLRKVAAKENVMIVQRYEAQRLLTRAQDSRRLSPDEFERSESGYVCLAQYLAQAISVGIFGEAARLQSDPKSPPPRN